MFRSDVQVLEFRSYVLVGWLVQRPTQSGQFICVDNKNCPS